MIERASYPDKKKKFVKEDILAKVPAKQDVAEQGTKKRKGGHMKMVEQVSSLIEDYLVIYRANGNFRAFNYLLESLKMGQSSICWLKVSIFSSMDCCKDAVFGLEVEVESTVALDLIRFIKQQLNEE
ncbi:hypothetical protein Tco_1361390 [Tanacetum coccineum]